MKKILSFVTGAFLLSTIFVSSAQAATCGNWYDVPASYKTILTEVCEYGLMQGRSETDYGFGDDLNRVEAATIGDRIVMGSESYDNAEYSLYEVSLELDDIYSDIPEANNATHWMIKAIYFARENDVMHGDDGKLPTTFRHLDTINIPETFKVFFEAFDNSHMLSDKVEYSNIDYDRDPWYEDLMNVMEKEDVISSLNYDNESFTISGTIGITYYGFSTKMQREDAALFLHAMITNDMIDEEKLMEHVNN